MDGNDDGETPDHLDSMIEYWIAGMVELVLHQWVGYEWISTFDVEVFSCCRRSSVFGQFDAVSRAGDWVCGW